MCHIPTVEQTKTETKITYKMRTEKVQLSLKNVFLSITLTLNVSTYKPHISICDMSVQHYQGNTLLMAEASKFSIVSGLWQQIPNRSQSVSKRKQANRNEQKNETTNTTTIHLQWHVAILVCCAVIYFHFPSWCILSIPQSHTHVLKHCPRTGLYVQYM